MAVIFLVTPFMLRAVLSMNRTLILCHQTIEVSRLIEAVVCGIVFGVKGPSGTAQFKRGFHVFRLVSPFTVRVRLIAGVAPALPSTRIIPSL